MSTKPTATGNAALRYSLMRLGVFALCFVVVWGLVRLRVLPAGLGDSNYLWVLLLAVVVSAPLSFVLLRRQREEMAGQVAARVERAKKNLAANRSQEDEVDDAARRSAES